jgi:hypothetical protein
VARALGGRPGQRLLKRLGMPTDRQLTPAERAELIGALNVLSRYTERATGRPLPFQVMDHGKVCIDFENISISIAGLAAKPPVSNTHEHWDALALLEREMSSVI